MLGTLSADPAFRIAVVVFAITLLLYVTPALDPEQMEWYGDNVATYPLLLVALLSLRNGLTQISSSTERRFWKLISLAFAAWLAAGAMYVRAWPSQSWTLGMDLLWDSLYVMFYLFFLLAVDEAPGLQRAPSTPVRTLRNVGAAIFLCGLLVYYVLVPARFDPQHYRSWAPSLQLYFTLDVVLLVQFARLARATSSRRWRILYAWLTLAAGLWSATDLVNWLTFEHLLPYVRSGTLRDLAWYLPIGAVVIASRLRHHPFRPDASEEHDRVPAAARGASWTLEGGVFVAYAFAFPLMHFGLYALGALEPDGKAAREVVVLVSIAGLAFVAMAYQKLLENETRRLDREREEAWAGLERANRELERRVEERTEMLSDANRSLEQTAREKGVLLQEVQHRVKNNLQLVSSLLNLQARRIEDPALREQFQQSRQRVHSMALVHEALYTTGSYSEIDAETYLVKLTSHLRSAFMRAERPPPIQVAVDAVRLPVTEAIPCGLIVNELVTNALRHAFPWGREGVVRVELQKEAGLVTLSVRDTGVGLGDTLDRRRTGSSGLALVQTLTAQLSGNLEVTSRAGAEFKLTFASSTLPSPTPNPPPGGPAA